MKNINIKRIGATIAFSITGLSLTGCINQSNKEETREALQIEMNTMKERKAKLTEEWENLDQTEAYLDAEKDELEHPKFDLEELYFLDTDQITSTEKSNKYILTKKELYYEGYIVCQENEGCWYLRRDGYHIDVPDCNCYTTAYEVVGREDDLEFYFTEHYHNVIEGNTAPYYLTVDSSNQLYHSETVIYNYYTNDVDIEKARQFHNIVKPLKNVLKEEDIKLSYTESEMRKLENKINEESYIFSTNKEKMLVK